MNIYFKKILNLFTIIIFCFLVRDGILAHPNSMDKYHIIKHKKIHKKYCKPTRHRYDRAEPVKFLPTNNLLMKQGDEFHYLGKKIIIIGKILNSKCEEVSDAKIYLWQSDHKGKYPYSMKHRPAHHHSSSKKRSKYNSFTGNGTATSNNAGNFWFVTILPTKKNLYHKKHAHIRVYHRNYKQLDTSLILDEKHKVKDLSDFQNIPDDVYEVYKYDIILANKYH